MNPGADSLVGELQVLDKILIAESRLKFQDQAVFGGFSHFLLGRLESFVDRVPVELATRLGLLIGGGRSYRIDSIQARRVYIRSTREWVTDCLEAIVSPKGSGQRPPKPRPRPDRSPSELGPLSPVGDIPGVGSRRVDLLGTLGIRSVKDLLLHIPNRYLDRRNVVGLADLMIGVPATFKGKVVSLTRPRGWKKDVQGVISDSTGEIKVTWFRQPYVADRLKTAHVWIFNGMLRKSKGRVTMSNPDIIGPDGESVPDVLPVYPTVAGLDQKTLRRIISSILPVIDSMPDLLPDSIRRAAGVMAFGEAVRSLHTPMSPDLTEEARRRLVFEELFLLELTLKYRRRIEDQMRAGTCIPTEGFDVRAFESALGFGLTTGQASAIKAIHSDLAGCGSMSRLLQGDVGCGKTAVALAGVVVAHKGGFQCALMAPTEILAEQHHLGLVSVGSRLGLVVERLTGSTARPERARILTALAEGRVDLIVGTHALLTPDVAFRKLGLVIVDEQHRFGVLQRDRLLQGDGAQPNLLVMTATPIPRSLALAVYGDLDLTVIDEMPAGRKPVKTRWETPESIPAILEELKNEVEKGRQAYVVCPLVEESDLVDRRDATQVFDELRRGTPAHLRLGLLHGRMKNQEREALMAAFRSGGVDILVATTVIEVGVDVPNATFMVILDAGTFGLSQLHQLRGRIGRGTHPSTCILVSPRRGGDVSRRLETLTRTIDGFKIAEADLEIRGPGELFGTRQSGLSDLRYVDFTRDVLTVALAHRVAEEVLAADPGLTDCECGSLRAQVEQKMEAFRLH